MQTSINSSKEAVSIKCEEINDLQKTPDSSMLNISVIDLSTGKIRKSSSMVVGWNLTNLMCGVGVLGIPYGVLLMGWSSLLLIGLAGFLTHFTAIWLIDCLYENSGERNRVMDGYAEIGRKVWPRAGHILVYATMLIELFSVLSLLLLLMSQTTRQMADFFWDVPIDQSIWYAIVTYATALLILFRHMTMAAWFGMIAAAAVVSTIVSLLVFCFIHHDELVLTNMPSLPEPLTASISIGIFIFSFCSHATFPTIESHMSEPKSFPSVVRMSFALSSIFKMALGALCVLIFGSLTDEQVTRNIPRTQAIHFITACFVTINVVLTIPLMIFVLQETIDRFLLPRISAIFAPEGRLHVLWILATRMIMLTCAMVVGMSIPHFSLLMALIGSATATSLALIFPALFHVSLKWKQLTQFQRGCRIAVGVLGICVAIIGSVSSLLKIIEATTIDKTSKPHQNYWISALIDYNKTSL